MTSFLPLLEAFLALALTMLVLTTGVSSLSGTWQRALRARARGLRDLLQSLFTLALKEKLSAQNLPADAAALCRFVGEMSLQPARLAEIATKPDDAQAAAYRARLPDQGIVADPHPAAISRLAGLWSRLSYEWKVWSSLSDTLDTLSEDEFKTRFSASTAGKALAAQMETAVDAAGFEAGLQKLYEQFIAYGHAATEDFSRIARRHSLVFAAMLAFGANIDAFNLLETYLAQPALRGAIIARYESTAKTGAADPQKADAPAANASPSRKIDELEKLLLSAAPGKKDEIEAKAREARDAIQATESAYADTRQVLTHATTTFPAGWDRYPGCDTGNTDPRCTALLALAPGHPKASWAGGSAWSALGNDTSRALRWLIGVILSVVMLGLGAPFWIQTINGLLRARDLVRGGNQAGDGTRPPATTN